MGNSKSKINIEYKRNNAPMAVFKKTYCTTKAENGDINYNDVCLSYMLIEAQSLLVGRTDGLYYVTEHPNESQKWPDPIKTRHDDLGSELIKLSSPKKINLYHHESRDFYDESFDIKGVKIFQDINTAMEEPLNLFD